MSTADKRDAADTESRESRPGSKLVSVLSHALQALTAISTRETIKFVHQRGRLASAVVRPSLWLVIFASGFQNIFGISQLPPYHTYIVYQVYIVPGLLGMVLLFNSMQSSLAMVYDREMGIMRLLLTAPLPRSYLLLCKLIAGAVLSVLQAYAFLGICAAFGIDLPWWPGLLYALPAMFLASMMLGALGLLLSVYIKQLENFAGTMNFVIFPMFFMSPALYPLWQIKDAGALTIYKIAHANPFTYAVELVRFAMYGQFNGMAFGIVLGSLLVFFAVAVWGYNPQRGLVRRIRKG